MDELHIVFIDFGQAVDHKHPGALDLLNRDIERVNKFFATQGVEVIADNELMHMITRNCVDE
jgi:serine/threonine-protein kinase RIO1